MTEAEFKLKYHISPFHGDQIMEVLDMLYLEFTKEQALTMVEDYLDHADEIFNSKNTDQ